MDGGKVARRANGCVQVYMYVRVCVCRGVKKACNTRHIRASVHAGIVALLGATPAPSALSLFLCNAIPRVRTYNGSTARESRRRAIYPLLFAFAGRQRTEKTSTIFVLHKDQHEGRDRRSCFQFTTAITIACVALRLRTIGSLLFASVMYIATKIVGRFTSLFSRDIPSLTLANICQSLNLL